MMSYNIFTEENWEGTSKCKFLEKPYTGGISELGCGYDYPYGMHNAMIKDIEVAYNDATGKRHINFQISGIIEDTDEIEKAYRSFLNESGRTGSTYDNVWWNWFNIFEEYVLTYEKLPSIKTYYNGTKLGYWFNRQKERARAGLLDDIRINAINSVYPGKWY